MKRINLLPPEIAQRRRVRRQSSLLIVAFFVLAGLLAGTYVWRLGTLNSEQGRERRSQALVSTLEAKRAPLLVFDELKRTVDAKQALLVSTMEGDVAWSRLLTELSMVIPEESWLTAFTGTTQAPGTVPPGGTNVAVGPTRLGTVSFTAVTFKFPDVANWITRLQGLKSLQNVWVPDAKKSEIGAREVVNFTSTADLSESAASGRFKKVS